MVLNQRLNSGWRVATSGTGELANSAGAASYLSEAGTLHAFMRLDPADGNAPVRVYEVKE